MSDFIAHVIAELDTQKALKKMSDFTNGKYKVNVNVDLTSKNGNVNTFLDQIKAQFQNAGQQAGRNFANSVNSSLGSINTKNSTNTIRNLERTLASFKFDRSQISMITDSLNSMDIAVQKVNTRIRQGGKLELQVIGVDDLGRTVTILKEFDSVSGTLTNVGKNISQTFKNTFNNTDVINLNTSISQLSTQFKELDSSATNVQDRLSSLKSRLAEIGNIQGVDKQNAEFQAIKQELDELRAEYKKFNAETKDAFSAASLMSQKTILGNQLQTWMNKNTKAARIYKDELESIQKQLASVDSKSALKNVANQFKEIKSLAATQGNLGKTLFGTLKSNITKLSPLFGMGSLISTAIRGLKDMYQNVLNIDSAMTELKKVTNETASTYESLTKTASKRAVEIGISVADYINSTADFARLGYSVAEAKELAEVANIYAVVGDEVESIDVASQSVISTMKAFGIEASSAMSIVDKFNEVGNNFAISSGGIGDALTRSASSMAAANNTLDETIALITAANTVVQDADVVGTSLKTISMRIRGAETELAEAGLDTEGMAESTAKLRKEILALSGVDIMLDENTFKSTYQILEELSEKWKDLTDIQQASITELIAGKRQGNVVSALMTNFNIAEDALQTSLDSNGSAMQEHEKWMESLEAKVSQLGAAWEALSTSFLSSDFLKNGVSLLTGFVQLLDTLISKIGMLGTLTIGAGITGFIKNLD